MTDDDAWEMDARRRATQLRDEQRQGFPATGARRQAAQGVDVRPRPGRQFVLAEIGPGWIVYPNTTDEDFDRPALVVEVTTSRAPDPDTGELVDRTRFRCLRLPFNPAAPWTTLDAADIDTATLAGLDRIMASGAARWLVRPLNLRRRRVQLNLDETEALHDAWRLAGALAQ